MSKGLEALKEIDIWTNISNTKRFKEQYKTIEKELKVLELIKKQGIKLIIPNNDLSNEHIDIQIFTNTLSKDELELIKKELEL